MGAPILLEHRSRCSGALRGVVPRGSFRLTHAAARLQFAQGQSHPGAVRPVGDLSPFGQLVEDRRMALGLSKLASAPQPGVPRTTLWRAMRGAAELSVQQVTRLADLLRSDDAPSGQWEPDPGVVGNDASAEGVQIEDYVRSFDRMVRTLRTPRGARRGSLRGRGHRPAVRARRSAACAHDVGRAAADGLPRDPRARDRLAGGVRRRSRRPAARAVPYRDGLTGKIRTH
jgi:hypothetical protein